MGENAHMAGSPNTKKAVAPLLLLTMAVLVAGILAALTYDDGAKKATALPTPTTAPGAVTTSTAKSTTATAPTSSTSPTTLQPLPASTSTTGPAATTTTAVP